MDHAAVIAELGGPRQLAEALHCNRAAPYRWKKGGIPPERWRDVAELARIHGKPSINLAALAEGHPMNENDPANRASQFLLGNQLQRILRQGEANPARRAELLESLAKIEREDAAAGAAVPQDGAPGAPPVPNPAPMETTAGGLRLHGR